jgi:hypothetical protein
MNRRCIAIGIATLFAGAAAAAGEYGGAYGGAP